MSSRSQSLPAGKYTFITINCMTEDPTLTKAIYYNNTTVLDQNLYDPSQSMPTLMNGIITVVRQHKTEVPDFDKLCSNCSGRIGCQCRASVMFVLSEAPTRKQGTDNM